LGKKLKIRNIRRGDTQEYSCILPLEQLYFTLLEIKNVDTVKPVLRGHP
jgi:hypothetical protein